MKELMVVLGMVTILSPLMAVDTNKVNLASRSGLLLGTSNQSQGHVQADLETAIPDKSGQKQKLIADEGRSKCNDVVKAAVKRTEADRQVMRAKLQAKKAELQAKKDAECAKFYQMVTNHLTSAEAGNAEDQFWMAKFCLAYSQRLPDDKIDEKYEKAVESLEWLTKSADAGHTNAMYSLGKMLIDGDGYSGFRLSLVAQVGLGTGRYFSRNSRLDYRLKDVDERIVLDTSEMSRSTFAPDFVYKQDVENITNSIGRTEHHVKMTTYRRIYKQDIVRGLAYMKKAAQAGYLPAKKWFDFRLMNGLPEDLPTWECATNTLSLPAVGPTIKLTVPSRSDEALYRIITIDSTGKMVGISAEFVPDEDDNICPWHKPANDIVIEE